jgi:hypothetical protein
MFKPSFYGRSPSEASLSDAASAATTALDRTTTQTHWRFLSFLARLLGVDEDTLALLTSNHTDAQYESDDDANAVDESRMLGQVLRTEADDARGGRLMSGVRAYTARDE